MQNRTEKRPNSIKKEKTKKHNAVDTALEMLPERTYSCVAMAWESLGAWPPSPSRVSSPWDECASSANSPSLRPKISLNSLG